MKIQPHKGTALAFVCMLGVLFTFVSAASAGRPGGGSLPPAADVPEQVATVDRRQLEAPSDAFRRLEAVAAREGTVRAIVGLRTLFTPEGALSSSERATQRSAIVTARQQLTHMLAGTGFSLTHAYDTVPYVALNLSPEALEALQRSGVAATVQEDRLESPSLMESTRLVEATETAWWTISRHGSGQTIAVIDTGVDKSHPFLTGKVVSEACYTEGDCPGDDANADSRTTVGSGVPCTFAPQQCDHGTHVAGIAAGSGASAGVAFSGVAPAAKLISIQVFSQFTGPDCDDGIGPCAKAWSSDSLAALERAYALRNTFKIAAVNMSLGGGPMTSPCDADVRKEAIDNLYFAGIATVIASGNDGRNDAVSAPACISRAIAVGATTKSDTLSAFSNLSYMVDFLAPGQAINSSVPGGVYKLKSGTSMAAPHVAGAWAVMKQVANTASVETVYTNLKVTGRPFTVGAENVTRSRIRLLSASVRFKDTGFRLGFDATARGLDVASNGVGLAPRAGGPSSGSITISGIPSGAVITNAYLYWMTIGGPDDMAVFQGVSRTGDLRGASRDTCWNYSQSGPNRVYRATLPVDQVPGNGTYTVSGVGTGAQAHGQGASLVILYTRPVHGAPFRRVILREGAMSAVQGQTMAHTFDGLSVPSSGAAEVGLHVGMADGQAYTEDPMLLAGSPITPANFFGGSDGILWDDHTIAVSPSVLQPGLSTAVNSIRAGNDCLAWAYSALSFS